MGKVTMRLTVRYTRLEVVARAEGACAFLVLAHHVAPPGAVAVVFASCNRNTPSLEAIVTLQATTSRIPKKAQHQKGFHTFWHLIF